MQNYKHSVVSVYATEVQIEKMCRQRWVKAANTWVSLLGYEHHNERSARSVNDPALPQYCSIHLAKNVHVFPDP